MIYLKHTLELVEPLRAALATTENPLLRAYHDVRVGGWEDVRVGGCEGGMVSGKGVWEVFALLRGCIVERDYCCF